MSGKRYMPQPLAEQSVHVSRADRAEENNSPTTLVLVVALFLFCNSISLLVNIFDMISGLISEAMSMIMIDIGNLLVVFNATANFFIYISFSKAYRISLKRIFQKSSKKRKRPRTLI
ncbi:putative G-protein coupled receptor C02B8.5 [Toxocara canis]|uniref:Putative G-protein coupled receptor C02B8.5 n=1 Tax=Toxocara canis TaxID=6265 RepID=A0A0B2VP30_TOXCA|nr:putative G-protein coupled receptor C02B8.5 [Toxocara canis]